MQPVVDERGVHVFTVAMQIDVEMHASRVDDFDRLAAALPATTAAHGDGPRRSSGALHVPTLVAVVPVLAVVLLTAGGYL